MATTTACSATGTPTPLRTNRIRTLSLLSPLSMSRTNYFATKRTRRFLRWALRTVRRGWDGLAQNVSAAFRSHAAWSAKAWGAVYTSSFPERGD